eukprot:Skav216436  [mRNA]  locus=scaffold3139:504312:507796:- [translate_table: standard]
MQRTAGGVPPGLILQLAEEQVAEIAFVLGESGGDVARCLPKFDAANPNQAQLALRMIDAGIDFRREPASLKWCVSYLQGKVRSLREDKHYQCPSSWRGFIVPDFCQKLEPNEAIFWISEDKGYLTGQALVARNPCTAPWDVQKLTFLGEADIWRRGLPRFVHRCVVVLSASPDCKCAPADLLAGGDYDGDTVIVIAHQPIVDSFTPCGEEASRARDGVEKLVAEIVKEAGEAGEAGEAPSTTTAIDVHTALCEEHWLASENSSLTAISADWWTAISDERGVKDPKSVSLGLIHQLALDSKIPCDKISHTRFLEEVSKRLQVPSHDQVEMPHWHPRTLRQGVRQSSRMLGLLQNSIVPENLPSSWKKQYGGELYKVVFEGLQPSENPPSEIPDCAEWSKQAAMDVLDYFTSSGLLTEANRERYLKDMPHEQRLKYARAFYHAQYRHFLNQHRQKAVTEQQLEKLLLPAWELFSFELCSVHIQQTSPSVCLMSEEQRGRVKYRKER